VSAPKFTVPRVLSWIAASLALLIPCVWQERIQAGDLSSHLYNAWLALEIKRGAVPNLAIVFPWTNTLCDWMLEALLRFQNSVVAERVVSGAAVLVFFWGAFRLIHVATGAEPWPLAPFLAMMSYGLVFELGFLNYYVSTGLCLWILALLWTPDRRRETLAAPLAILALLAHALPVAWTALALGYLRLFRRITPHRRIWMLPAGVAGFVLLRILVISRFPNRWSLDQVASLGGVLGATGVEQVWLHNPKYVMVALGVLGLWWMLFLDRFDRESMTTNPIAHLCALNMAVFALAPSAVQLPQYQHVLAYIPQRVSLFEAVLILVLIGGARPSRVMSGCSCFLAAIFFLFLYVDDKALNVAESQMNALIATVPAGGRVVASVTDSHSRLSALSHAADRACIGHCFSYGNYEPASGQFRIRVLGANRAVAPNMRVVKEIEEGRHIVTEEEAPIYAICNSDSLARLLLRVLSAGDRTCAVTLPVSPEARSNSSRDGPQGFVDMSVDMLDERQIFPASRQEPKCAFFTFMLPSRRLL